MPNEASGAGWIYDQDQITVSMPPGAGQVSSVNALPRPFRWTLTKVSLIVKTVFAGAGATRTFNVRRGGPTGDVVATGVVTLAAGAAVGAVIDIPVTGGSADFLDAHNLTLEWPAAGAVAFTAGEIVVTLSTRKRTQQRN